MKKNGRPSASRDNPTKGISWPSDAFLAVAQSRAALHGMSLSAYVVSLIRGDMGMPAVEIPPGPLKAHQKFAIQFKADGELGREIYPDVAIANAGLRILRLTEAAKVVPIVILTAVAAESATIEPEAKPLPSA